MKLLTGLLAGAALCVPVGIAYAAAFDDDVAFLKKHVDTVVLSDAEGKAQVAVCGAYQGRVMTSTAQGEKGASFGWVNRELIASGEKRPHINVYGGEDRFWMGPEGGQFAIFFKKGAPKFDLENWQTPAAIDTEAFETVNVTKDRAQFKRVAQFPNYSGTVFDVQVDRTIQLMDRTAAEKALNAPVPASLSMVAYASENVLTNKGAEAWKPETGLLSIWILGMFNASPKTTVAIPFAKGSEAERGPAVNDAYFGKVPADRLKVGEGVLYFRGDAQYRSKIGLSPQRALPIMGSYDPVLGALTLIVYTKPDGAKDYVNSMWELQDKPFAGDVVNSYNDGPPAPGKKGLGAFYEIESSSPAAALAPNASIKHVHQTFHFQGKEADLDALAKKTLGVSLKDIQTAFASK